MHYKRTRSVYIKIKVLPSRQRGTVTNNLFPQCSTPTGRAFCGMYVPDASAISLIGEIKFKIFDHWDFLLFLNNFIS